MPVPLSMTSTITAPGDRRAMTLTRPAGGGACLNALVSKLDSTWRIRPASTDTFGRPDSTSTLMRAPDAGRLAVESAYRFFDQGGQVGRFPIQRQAAGFSQGNRTQVVDQLVECLDLRLDRCEMFGVRRIKAVLDALDLSGNHGERCPQLVSDVCQKCASALVKVFQSRAHAVEGAGQRSNLA